MFSKRAGAGRLWRAEWAQTRRWWPVAFGTKATLLTVGEVLIALSLFAMNIAMGGQMDGLIKGTVILPSLALILLCTADTVPDLRAKGELELAVTLAQPLRLLLHRMLPALAISLGQAALLLLAMSMLIQKDGWQVVFGFLALPAPLLYAISASLFWNLVLRGPGAILTASLLTLVPAFIWISYTPLILAGKVVEMGDEQIPFLKALMHWGLCQAGILAGAIALVILAMGRLARTEKLLHE